jgi:hypothetical protein
VLIQKPPLLTPRPINHRNYLRAKKLFGALCRSPIVDKTVALIGPTQAGKSLILAQCFLQAIADCVGGSDLLVPTIGLRAETSRDGRVSQRFMLLQCLKQLRHPLYEHIGELDELEHYVPQRGRDETAMRNATGRALLARGTARTFLDEAHHLTHTTDTDLQDRLFQSVKTLLANNRALFLAGGYELAYNGMFNSAHFSGRLIVVEFPAYSETQVDIVVFAGILRAWELVLPVAKGLLVANTIPLLRANNGIVGQAELQLFDCKVRAEASGVQIDEAMLYECMPTEAARDVIKEDIAKGREALKRCGKDFEMRSSNANQPKAPAGAPDAAVTSAGDSVRTAEESAKGGASVAKVSKRTKRGGGKPFSRSPKRRSTGTEHIKLSGKS